jgi:hypothetical protein
MATAYCKNCGHPAHRADCGVDDCGCVKYVPRPKRDAARLRTWVITASFFVRNRWVDAEVKVKAAGVAGAAMKGLREAKETVLQPRTRVEQTKITIVPVRGGAR